jgi:VCBS repeat-containing protein
MPDLVGNYTITTNTNYNGAVTLKYNVNDGIANTPAIQSVVLAAVNDLPTLTGTPATLASGTEDQSYTVSIANLLAGYTDVETANLTVNSVAVYDATGTTVVGLAMPDLVGNYTITTNTNYNGAVTLKYNVNDGIANTPAIQSVVLAAVNDAPTLSAVSVSGAITESLGLGASATIAIGTIVFQNQALANIVSVDGTLGGSWIVGGSADAYHYRYDALTNSATAQFQHYDGSYTKQVEIRFNQVGADIAATQLNAKYVTGNRLGIDFNQPPLGIQMNVAPTGQGGYGLPSLTAVLANGASLNYSGFISVAQQVVNTTVQASVQGVISFNDVDLTDRPSVSYQLKDVAALAGDQSTSLSLSATQLSEITAGFTASVRAGSTNSGSIDWNYAVDQSKLNFLGANQTVTLQFTVTVSDGSANSAPQDVTITITGTNDVPTLTAFAAPVDTTNEDTVVEITLADLLAQGNEADVDGTVNSFVVKALSSGSLKIGTTEASAEPWNASTNATVDTTNKAYWTPAANANGTLNAFTAVAKDNSGAESATSITATVSVAAVNDAPVIGAIAPVPLVESSATVFVAPQSTNLKLWLNASDLNADGQSDGYTVGTAVSTWEDLSLNTIDFRTLGASNQPTIQAGP